MFALAAKDLSNNDNYQALQQYLDVPSVIDYMLMVYLTGSRDAPMYLNNDSTSSRPQNFWAIYRREPPGRYRFMAWDTEWTLEDTGINRVNVIGPANQPHYLISKLKANPDFKMLMADRIYKFFANDGVLTPKGCIDRYAALAAGMDSAIVGESARWGDLKRSVPYTRADWLTEVNRLETQYFPVRTGIVLNQLKTAGLYPAISPPDFYVGEQLLHGGHLPVGGTAFHAGYELGDSHDLVYPRRQRSPHAGAGRLVQWTDARGGKCRQEGARTDRGD